VRPPHRVGGPLLIYFGEGERKIPLQHEGENFPVDGKGEKIGKNLHDRGEREDASNLPFLSPVSKRNGRVTNSPGSNTGKEEKGAENSPAGGGGKEKKRRSIKDRDSPPLE